MARTVYLAANADSRLREWIEGLGYKVETIETSGIVAGPVSSHPDMFMCRLGCTDDAAVVFYHEGVGTVLREKYPEDIAFNAACTGRYFIHNLRHTAPILRSAAEKRGMIPVDVKQGYTKCSTVIVDENSIITYDKGIGSACMNAGMDVLLVEPGHVLLPGYDKGFIGGASGRVGDIICFNGNLGNHPDFDAITEFIEGRGLKVKWFEDWPLTDIGTIY